MFPYKLNYHICLQGNLSTYKELCSLASDLNRADLVYKFMTPNHNVLWNSKQVKGVVKNQLIITHITSHSIYIYLIWLASPVVMPINFNTYLMIKIMDIPWHACETISRWRVTMVQTRDENDGKCPNLLIIVSYQLLLCVNNDLICAY